MLEFVPIAFLIISFILFKLNDNQIIKGDALKTLSLLLSLLFIVYSLTSITVISDYYFNITTPSEASARMNNLTNSSIIILIVLIVYLGFVSLVLAVYKHQKKFRYWFNKFLFKLTK